MLPAIIPANMLIKFCKQTIDKFRIPAFTLSKGEIVIIKLPGGPYFQPLAFEMIDLLTGKQHNEFIEVYSPLKYAEHIKANSFWNRIFPLTVGAYLNKNANKANPICKTIYDIEWMTPKIKIQNLAGTPRRKLSILTTLSWTNNIIFDLVGVNPQGGVEIYNLVKIIVQSGGAAILFDHNDKFKNDCTAFVEAEYLGG